jgi:SAM domain (Sterile alpha motif)/Adenylate and Guanylate cyclase catalytic domain
VSVELQELPKRNLRRATEISAGIGISDVPCRTCRYKLCVTVVEKLTTTGLLAVAMEQIEGWLKKLGLSEYTERFVENDIEIDVLSELTDRDLQQLGISLGHRRKILRAIRELGGGAAPATPQPAAPAEPKPRDEAERRQLTVMFTDLVGSTALSARLDPEDFARVIGSYQNVCASTVAKFGGSVAKYLGDGVLAYFGYPEAHEDDSERAVRAGLQLIDAISAIDPRSGFKPQVRVGVATGLVVVVS